jgi:hypothetical protein
MQNQRVDKRRILLFLPLFLLPLLAMAFYALGGGHPVTAGSPGLTKGINTVLPDAQFKKEVPTDKMGIYNLVKGDSTRVGHSEVQAISANLGYPDAGDGQAKQINAKLAAINQVVNSRQVAPAAAVMAPVGVRSADAGSGKEVARLESLMKNMQQSGGQGDPEMAQLNTLMDKILDAQNPGRAKDRLSRVSARIKPDSLFKAIPAVVEGTQKVTEGSVVKLRLLDTVVLNGQTLPKGQLIFGLAALSNQRLNLEIKNIRVGNAIVPVNLTVFDKTDAMPGINAPEALIGNAVGGGADNALQNMQFMGMDQSLSVQAAGAGIDAAKSLFSKKIRRIKVKLKGGYPLLLRDNTKKNH